MPTTDHVTPFFLKLEKSHADTASDWRREVVVERR
jgi:hypothetical protein